MAYERWQAEWNALLGKEKDRILARRLGVPHWTVTAHRRDLGIQRYLVDRSGARFGRWTLVRLLAPGFNYEARCDCGRVVGVRLHNITSGRSTGCARCRDDRRTLKPGARRGNQEIVDVTGQGERRRYYVRCGGCGKIRKTDALRFGQHCAECRPPMVPDTYGERITLDGETHNFAAWAKKLGITRQALHLRIARGWTLLRALTTPRAQ